MGRFDVVPVTADYLTGIFRDGNFIRKVRKVDEVSRRGGEGCFRVCQVYGQNEYGITCVCEGEHSYSTGSGKPLLDEADREMCSPSNVPFKEYRQDFYILIDVHGHPDGNVDPSLFGEDNDVDSGDLPALHDFRTNERRHGILAYPVMALVGQSNQGNKRVDMLLIQEIGGIVSGDHLQDATADLYEGVSFETGPDPQEIADRLRMTGMYKSEAIGLDGRGYSKGSMDKVASFASTPEIIDGKAFEHYINTGLPISLDLDMFKKSRPEDF